MKLYSIINESIEDKGIFKACFVVGIPGAGKSYTIQQIKDGQIEPRIVNTDKAFEFLSTTTGFDITSKDPSPLKRSILDKSKILTKGQLLQYINGMLPLFVDSTSGDATNILRRKSLLESFGYDTALIWIDTDLEQALERARARSRFVSEDAIRSIHKRTKKNVEYLKNKFDVFHTINNNEGMLDNEVMLSAYRTVSGFFHSNVKNPIGQRTIDRMKKNGWKYLIPNIYTKEQLNRFITTWYIKLKKEN